MRNIAKFSPKLTKKTVIFRFFRFSHKLFIRFEESESEGKRLKPTPLPHMRLWLFFLSASSAILWYISITRMIDFRVFLSTTFFLLSAYCSSVSPTPSTICGVTTVCRPNGCCCPCGQTVQCCAAVPDSCINDRSHLVFDQIQTVKNMIQNIRQTVLE